MTMRQRIKSLIELSGKVHDLIGMNGLGRFEINNMIKQIVSSETVPQRACHAHRSP